MLNNKKVIIDTDAGFDDLFAIYVALKSTKINLIKLVSSYGNFTQLDAFANLEKFLKKNFPDKKSILVHGSNLPLSGNTPIKSSIHGEILTSISF